ncbi:MAG: NAD(P)/FAD-dependent oxidoreductase [Clostridia bacterium]|nr:NAD(P)/FAD-dependent oxidoreductase [Clostridia bacterium]
MHKVVIIGGGASGLFAGVSAINTNKSVTLIEKNEKLGKKIYITGKGRCNLTNNVLVNDFMQNVVSNPKFLYSALNNFTPQDTISFFESNKMPTKTERGNRVFPVSEKASDVTKTLENYLRKNGAEILLNTCVKDVLVENNKVIGVLLINGNKIFCDSVIVATGGISYPLTGSDGDGFKFAKKLGHSIIELKPALCSFELKEDFYKNLQGLALKNVKLTVKNGNKVIFSQLGEMLFTHFGVSGPLILTASSLVNRLNLENLDFEIDLKPALNKEILESRLLNELSVNSNSNFFNVARGYVPKSFVEILLKRSQINGNKKCCVVTQENRNSFINTLKSFKFKVSNIRDVREAVVTAGGVNVKEINPKTMESKIINGLYFCGEVIDIDAFTGGFNLQIAFSTGYTAGLNC